MSICQCRQIFFGLLATSGVMYIKSSHPPEVHASSFPTQDHGRVSTLGKGGVITKLERNEEPRTIRLPEQQSFSILPHILLIPVICTQPIALNRARQSHTTNTPVQPFHAYRRARARKYSVVFQGARSQSAHRAGICSSGSEPKRSSSSVGLTNLPARLAVPNFSMPD